MKNMKRSIRRHHYARLKNKRYRQLRLWEHWYRSEEYMQHLAAKRSRTPCMCSCWMCGNPRTYGEISLQEIRNNLSYKEQIGDVV